MVSVRAGYVFDRGEPIHYLEWGERRAPPVILYGGIRHFAFEWQAIAERLKENFHVIGVDPRGHGNSAPFPGGMYDPSIYVHDLKTVVDQLTLDRPAMIGFSIIGSGAVVECAATHPNDVSALVLVDGGLGYGKQATDVACARFRSAPHAFPDWASAVTYLSEMGDQGFASPQDIEARAPYVFRHDAQGNVVWKHDPVLRDIWAGEDWQRNTGFQPKEVWEKVECPILIAKTGSQVHLSEAQCDEMAHYGRGSRWERIPGLTSHFVYDENPRGFADMVAPFLQDARA